MTLTIVFAAWWVVPMCITLFALFFGFLIDMGSDFDGPNHFAWALFWSNLAWIVGAICK